MKECVFLLVMVHERMYISASYGARKNVYFCWLWCMKECVFLLVTVHERMCIFASYGA